MNKRIQTKYAVIVFIAASVGMAMLFNFTDPQNSGLFGILLVIISIYFFFVSAMFLAYSVLGKFVLKRKSSATVDSRLPLYTSAILAFAPILLIILNSLGTIGIVELLLTVLFEAAVIFLVRKRAVV